MSEENVEIVRKVYEAVARGEADTVLSFYDTDIEWDVSQSPYRAVVGRDTYRGHDGLRSASYPSARPVPATGPFPLPERGGPA